MMTHMTTIGICTCVRSFGTCSAAGSPCKLRDHCFTCHDVAFSKSAINVEDLHLCNPECELHGSTVGSSFYHDQSGA